MADWHCPSCDGAFPEPVPDPPRCPWCEEELDATPDEVPTVAFFTN